MSNNIKETHTYEQIGLARAIEFAGIIGRLTATCTNAASRVENNIFMGDELVSYLNDAAKQANEDFNSINQDPYKYREEKATNKDKNRIVKQIKENHSL